VVQANNAADGIPPLIFVSESKNGLGREVGVTREPLVTIIDRLFIRAISQVLVLNCELEIVLQDADS
jgi:hypothetical protein